MAIRRPTHKGEYNRGLLYKFESDVDDPITAGQRLIDYNNPYHFRFTYTDGQNEDRRSNTLTAGWDSSASQTVIETTSTFKFEINEIVEINGVRSMVINVVPTNINQIKNLRGNKSETHWLITLS